MIFGTHNSGTGEKLVWWQRPFGALLNATSRCQDMTIKEQLEFGVRFFNLQITMYKGEWVFSHGICVYTGKLLDAIELMNNYAIKELPIYYQLYLDKNFLLGQKKDEFRLLVNELALKSAKSNVKLHSAWIEGTKEYPYSNDIDLDCYESYWTQSWAKNNAKSWIDKLPLPKRWAKLHNQEAYDKGMKHQFFMGDFVNHYINYVKEPQTTQLTPKPTIIKPTVTPTSTPTPSIVPNGIKCILNVIGTGINTIKNKEFYFVFNNISTYTIHIKAKSGYNLPANIEANGCNVKSWNPTTGKLVINNIAQDGEFAYFPSITVNATVITTVTPTATPTITPTVTPTSTISYFTYDLTLKTEGKLTNTSSAKLIIKGDLYDSVADRIVVNCTSKYASFVGNDLSIHGQTKLNHVIGYINPTGIATANYRFPITAYITTYDGETAFIKSNVVIYGADIVTPIPTVTPTFTPTVTPTITVISTPT